MEDTIHEDAVLVAANSELPRGNGMKGKLAEGEREGEEHDGLMDVNK